jgi:hypothetical protein
MHQHKQSVNKKESGREREEEGKKKLGVENVLGKMN